MILQVIAGGVHELVQLLLSVMFSKPICLKEPDVDKINRYFLSD